MPDSLPVHVNRRERNSLEVPPAFETDDSFVIRVENHGNAGRVHVHLDEHLSAVASVDEPNHYVEANAVSEIPVSVHVHQHVRGKIKVVVGYGATTRWVDVELTEPTDTGGVEVDEELAEPPETDPEPNATARDADGIVGGRPEVPVLALGVLALLVAAGAATLFDSALVAAGAVVVVLGVLVAGLLLVR